MPRIRSIKPSVCTSASLAALSDGAERLFMRLWTQADDDGRALADPRIVKAQVFPLNDEKTPDVVVSLLDELEGKGFITRYVVDATLYLVIGNFTEHQHPRHRVSQYPSPPEIATGPSNLRGGSSRNRPPVVVGVVVDVDVEELAPAPLARRVDPLFDALMEACEIDVPAIPPSARGAYNRALKDLRSVEATPDTIFARAGVFRRRWPGASLTPTALSRRWPELDPLRVTYGAPTSLVGRSQDVLRRAATQAGMGRA